jgi:hypothetical protein
LEQPLLLQLHVSMHPSRLGNTPPPHTHHIVCLTKETPALGKQCTAPPQNATYPPGFHTRAAQAVTQARTAAMLLMARLLVAFAC